MKSLNFGFGLLLFTVGSFASVSSSFATILPTHGQLWYQCRSADGAVKVQAYFENTSYPDWNNQLTVKERWSFFGYTWMQGVEGNSFDYEVNCGRDEGFDSEQGSCYSMGNSRYVLVSYDEDPYRNQIRSYLLNRSTGEKLEMSCRSRTLPWDSLWDNYPGQERLRRDIRDFMNRID